MGTVNIDLYSDELEFKVLSLSDFYVVKWLIQFRDKIDPYFNIELNNNIYEAGDVNRFNQEIINIYVYLDELIERRKFNKQQLGIIYFLSRGYTYKETGDILNIPSSHNVHKKFNKICKDIVKMNEWVRLSYTYKNVIGMRTKVCSKCKEELPAIDEFFTDKKDAKDGFHPYCKMCRR